MTYPLYRHKKIKVLKVTGASYVRERRKGGGFITHRSREWFKTQDKLVRAVKSKAINLSHFAELQNLSNLKLVSDYADYKIKKRQHELKIGKSIVERRLRERTAFPQGIAGKILPTVNVSFTYNPKQFIL